MKIIDPLLRAVGAKTEHATSKGDESNGGQYMPDELFPKAENRPAISTKRLSRLDVQRASNDVKRFCEDRLENDFNLVKVGNQ